MPWQLAGRPFSNPDCIGSKPYPPTAANVHMPRLFLLQFQAPHCRCTRLRGHSMQPQNSTRYRPISLSKYSLIW